MRRLGPALKKRYGANDSYTPGQLRTTMEKMRVPAEVGLPAAAMFLTPPAFFEMHPKVSAEEHDALREEIAAYFFDGDASFTSRDAVGVYAAASLWGGARDGFADGGGTSFGDGSSGGGN